MDTTTSEGGAEQAQPQSQEAVTEGHNADQVITTDENGTPTLEPTTSNSAEAEPAAAPQETAVAQAPEATQTDQLKDWATKKGLEINFDNPNEVKLANMQLNAEKKMHEATATKVAPPAPMAPTGNEAVDEIVERQNQNELRMYVRDWFDANPDMKSNRNELLQIAQQRPWLVDMDDVKAHFLANPTREQALRQEGGKQALTNLAQKQQQIPPGSNATNSGVYESAQISPSNVFELIDKNDQAWFEKNHDAISKAISGK